jgi:hypothetical protein
VAIKPVQPTVENAAATKAKRIHAGTQALLLLFGVALVALGFVFILARSGVGPSTVVTTGTSPDTTVVTTAGHTALGSDTIDSFLLSGGVVLILVGAFYPRISKIGLPGGGSIELTPVAQAKVAAAVGKDLQDPDQISAAYQQAVANLTTQFWGDPATPSDEAIQRAALAAKDLITQQQ